MSENNRSKFADYDVSTIADLTWEVLEARGIDVGDLMHLWTICHVLMDQIESMDSEQNIVISSIMASGQVEFAMQVMVNYIALRGYITRDAQEILKFLYKRNFHFPDGE